MIKNTPTELMKYKEDFNFLHEKIGELEWDIATIFFERKAVKKSEIEILEDQLDSYKTSISILINRMKNEIAESRNMKK